MLNEFIDIVPDFLGMVLYERVLMGGMVDEVNVDVMTRSWRRAYSAHISHAQYDDQA